MFSKKIDFLAVGDIVVDAFIKLKDAHVSCDVNNERCEICMKFGDKIPFESATVVPAVGNSANAAVAAARLGLSSALLSDVGSDRYGAECVAALKKEGVRTSYVRVHQNMATNYHYVLWYGDERTILVKHEEYARSLPKLPTPRWLYLSSLGSNSYEYQEAIAKWLDTERDVKLAFQPGTFQMSLGAEKLARIYRRTEIFFCNKEEAQRILATTESEPKKLMDMLRSLGPRTIVLTDGPKGAYASDGTDAFFMPPYPDPKPPVERTGAGDAYASTCVIALAKGKTLREALTWAPINSASVVQDIGAQRGLLNEREILAWLSKAPKEYSPKTL